MSTLDVLPNEILIKIFSLLEVMDLKRVACVSTRWKELSCSPRVWRGTELGGSRSVLRGACLRAALFNISTSPLVWSISIPDAQSDGEMVRIFNCLAKHCVNLHKLHLGTTVTDVVLARLRQLSKVLHTVQEISLYSRPHHVDAVFASLGHFKSLKKVTLLSLDMGGHDLASLFDYCHGIEVLELPGYALDDRELVLLHKHRYKLEQLNINVNACSSEGLQMLADFPKLRSLHLEHTAPDRSILAVIGQLKQLSRLVLSEGVHAPVLPSAALTDFLHAGQFQALRELFLLRSRLTDEGVKEIRCNCPQLRRLEVAMYPRCEEKLTSMALRYLVHCPRLQFFEVIANDTTDWAYRRERYVTHSCVDDETCPEFDLLLSCWTESLMSVI